MMGWFKNLMTQNSIQVEFKVILVKLTQLNLDNLLGSNMLENNINHIMVSKPWWPSGHEFKSHHPHLCNKN
jgi:hypothetical protein